MRVFGKVVLTAIGALLLLVGGAAAWIVGPDDTVVAGETEFSTGTAYTARGLFDVENLDVQVTAEADEGEVFIGVGNPVDVTDVVSDQQAFRISQVHVGSLSGSVDDGEEPVPDPRGIDWFDSVSGKGEQTLSYPIDGMSPQFLVYSPSGAPVTVSIGFSVAGAFALCLVVAGVGLVLLVGGILLRGRRPAKSRGESGGDAVGTEGERASSAEPRQEASGTTLGRVAAVLGVGALILPLSACGAIPEIPSRMAETPATKVALTPDELDAMWKDYDKRYNAANKDAFGPTFDASKLMAVDTGVVAEWDQYKAAYMRAYNDIDSSDDDKPDTVTTTGDWVSSPAFGSYPMWAVASQAQSSSGDEKKDEKKKDEKKDEDPKFESAAVVVKEAADEPWKLRSLFVVPKKDMGKFPEVVPTPTAAQVDSVEQIADAADRYLVTGKKQKEIDDLGGLKLLRAGLKKEADADWSKDADWSLGSKPFDDDSVHVIPAGDTLYAVIDKRVTSKLRFPSDHSPYWNPPGDAVNGRMGSTLFSQRAVSVLVRIPADGSVTFDPTYSWTVIADSM